MESILDTLTADKLYQPGGTHLLDLEELHDGDFLTNVVSHTRLSLLVRHPARNQVRLPSAGSLLLIVFKTKAL